MSEKPTIAKIVAAAASSQQKIQDSKKHELPNLKDIDLEKHPKDCECGYCELEKEKALAELRRIQAEQDGLESQYEAEDEARDFEGFSDGENGYSD